MCQLMIRYLLLSNCSQRFGCLGSSVSGLIGLYLLKLMHLSYKMKQTAKALPG